MGRGEGGVSLGKLSHRSLSYLSFFSGSPQPWGSNDLIHMGPQQISHHSPSPWHAGPAAMLPLQFPSLFNPWFILFYIMNPFKNQKAANLLPRKKNQTSKKYTCVHLCVQFQRIEHMLIRVHELQVKDPLHKPCPYRFEIWPFILLQCVCVLMDCMRRALLLFYMSCDFINYSWAQVHRIGLIWVLGSSHTHYRFMQNPLLSILFLWDS